MLARKPVFWLLLRNNFTVILFNREITSWFFPLRAENVNSNFLSDNQILSNNQKLNVFPDGNFSYIIISQLLFCPLLEFLQFFQAVGCDFTETLIQNPLIAETLDYIGC